MKSEVIIEKAVDNHLWGRIYYNDDLLITNGKTTDEIIKNFQEQFEAFYNLATDKSNFEIQLIQTT